ncbi:RNA polymerase sigma factor [Nocardioides coralli]|uniref:RNA polymerase sigma factor n=1 Tax=Nocardioides coralli TaxID=2872154 RepID=UPI001CA4274C|nr:sigma-70 family RNA polymerase sigma factor [Nocardioides coralli]QZY30354.1 sigma-70 family RNA polymerase sigma factor [Nocardioides coralli]
MRQAGREDALTTGVVVTDVEGGRERGADVVRDQLLDVLFREHYPTLLRLAVVMLGDRGAAEDAVQDAFVSLHRHWKRLRDHDAAAAYLRTAVLNRCRSWVRREVVRRAARPLRVLPDPPPDPEDAALAHERAGSVVAQMRTLPARQRDVLACRFVLELSVEETAQLLEIGEGTVKAHTHRGLRALQKRIEVAP